MTNNRLTPLRKLITREALMLVVEKWHQGLVKETREFYGFDFPESLFIFRNKTVESWRVEEKIVKLGFRIGKWIKASKENSDKLYESFEAKMNCIAFVNDVKNKLKNKVYDSPNKVLKDIAELRELFPKGYIGLWNAYYFPLFAKLYNTDKEILYDKNLVEKCKEIRIKGENFYDDAVDVFYKLATVLAEITGFDKGLLKYMTYDEIVKSIEHGSLYNTEEIEKRSKSVFGYIDGNIVYENDLELFLKGMGYTRIIDKVEKADILKGSVANPGYAEGPVKKLLCRDELHEFKEGDILVAPMTDIWHLPAIKKSSAIVTDEGGVITHAAIAAREFNKPCVIATGFATDILKNGDLVEVDANKGIVRIRKKSL